MNMKFVRTWVMLALTLVVGLSVTGGTIAWFTDSVETATNTIKAGNLDMEVSYKPYGAQYTTWLPVTERTELFNKDALYEPGYTEAFWLKVENVGDLAFRYNAALKILFETAGINKEDKAFNLSDYLYLNTAISGDVAGFETQYNTREKLLNEYSYGSTSNSIGNKKLSELDKPFVSNATAFSKDDPTMGADWSSSYVLVVLNMPTTVGNEANYKTGTAAPTISLGLSLEAIQLPYEDDDFGTDYDTGAEYTPDESYGAPKAQVRPLTFATAPDIFPVNNGINGTNQTIDKAYSFKALDTEETVKNSKYKDWNADFVITFDNNLKPDTVGLGGQYQEAYGDTWVTFDINQDLVTKINEANNVVVEDNKYIPAGTPIRLLDSAKLLNSSLDFTFTYEMICSLVGTFNCGAYTIGTDAHGTTITVELRLFETDANGDETGNFIPVNKFNYKFGTN